MMGENTSNVVLPDPRYEVCGARSIRARVERAAGQVPAGAEATLLDISQYGAKLLISCACQVHELVTLQVEVPEVGEVLSLPAIVRWCVSSSSHAWRLGCVFTGALPQRILNELALLGYLERRKDERQAVDLPARARWELAEEDFPIRIVDVSAGGLCICCEEEEKIGERLLVQVNEQGAEPVLVWSRAVWQRTQNGQQLIGCRWASREDYELLCTALRVPAMRGSPTDCPQPKSTWRLAVLIAVSAIFLLMWLVLR